MSNVLIGIIGVILFIGLALAGALFLGPRFSNSRTQSEAARYMAEGAQISKAYEMYRINEGAYPTGRNPTTSASYDPDPTRAKLVELRQGGYLKSIPIGGRSGSSTTPAWYIDDERGAALTQIGDDSGSRSICVEARRQAGIPNPETVLACNASNITNNDPCCTIG